MSESIKYIVDAKGKTREVIIPIQLWKRLAITSKTQNKKIMGKKKLSKYLGVLTLSIDPMKYQKEIRNEWQ